ncbi:hypothetical protein DW810_04195 [Phocaeicola vulgatus]|nr:hypothetical protein DW810_04195 [Phocaeicola vulgatus]
MALDISTDSQFVKSINIELSLSKYEDNNNLKKRNTIITIVLKRKKLWNYNCFIYILRGYKPIFPKEIYQISEYK